MDIYKVKIFNVIYQRIFIENIIEKGYKLIRDEKQPLNELNCFVFWSDGTKKIIFTNCDNYTDLIFIKTKDELNKIIKSF